MHTVYIELFFLDNMIINYYILFFVSLMLKIKLKPIYPLLASFVGTLYGVLQFSGVVFLNNIFIKIILSGTMVFISFYQYKHLFKKAFVLFYSVSFLFGGLIFGIMYFGASGGIVNGVFVLPIPMRNMIIVLIVGRILQKYLTRFITMARFNTSFLKIEIFKDGKCVSLHGFLDTGNMAREPISDLPVVFANFNDIKDILAEDILNDFSLGEIKNSNDLKYIPYMTAGDHNGMVMGFCPEHMYVVDHEKRSEVYAYIALCNENFHGFSLLLHPQLLETATASNQQLV